jgi:hypothetical protein
LQYQSPRNGFDIMIAASEWAVAFWLTTSPSASAGSNRILLLEVGSVIYPTNAYIMCRITNVSRESASRPPNGRREADSGALPKSLSFTRQTVLVRAQHQYVPGSEFAIPVSV